MFSKQDNTLGVSHAPRKSESSVLEVSKAPKITKTFEVSVVGAKAGKRVDSAQQKLGVGTNFGYSKQ